MMKTKRPRRSVLFMPGDSRRKIEKATTLDVDSIVMDLEDGVALNQKEQAREVTLQCCREFSFQHREKCVRINALQSTLFQEDLNATAPGLPDIYVIPKAECPKQLQELCLQLTSMEAKLHQPQYTFGLFIIIESALGVMNVKELAQSTPRIQALMFGAEDLAGDMGAQRTPEEWEVLYARSAVVTAAAAFQVDAIDTIFPAFHELEGLEASSRFARQLGYRGKMAIHPKQLPILNQIFSPSESEIQHAQQLLQLHHEHQEKGLGAFAFQGKMVDMPMIRHAELIVEQARSIGILSTT